MFLGTSHFYNSLLCYCHFFTFTVYEVEVNISCCIRWNQAVIKDMKLSYVTHRYLPTLCCRSANSCDRYALYLYSRMDILRYCFLWLVQDVPALPDCRVFVTTATVLSGVLYRKVSPLV